MKLRDIVKLIDGRVLTGKELLDRPVKGGYGADLMSDVLASAQPDALLLTGLCNPQVVRTATIADVSAIIFVRGKMPRPETLSLAAAENLPLVSSPLGMFEICGRLFQAGLPSLETRMDDDMDDWADA